MERGAKQNEMCKIVLINLTLQLPYFPETDQKVISLVETTAVLLGAQLSCVRPRRALFGWLLM